MTLRMRDSAAVIWHAADTTTKTIKVSRMHNSKGPLADAFIRLNKTQSGSSSTALLQDSPPRGRCLSIHAGWHVRVLILLSMGSLFTACGTGSSPEDPVLATALLDYGLEGVWEYSIDENIATSCINTIEFKKNGSWEESSMMSLRLGTYAYLVDDTATVNDVPSAPVETTSETEASRQAIVLSTTYDNGLPDCVGASSSEADTTNLLYFDKLDDEVLALYVDESPESEPLALLREKGRKHELMVPVASSAGEKKPQTGAAEPGDSTEMLTIDKVLQLAIERAEAAQLKEEQKVAALAQAAYELEQIALAAEANAQAKRLSGSGSSPKADKPKPVPDSPSAESGEVEPVAPPAEPVPTAPPAEPEPSEPTVSPALPDADTLAAEEQLRLEQEYLEQLAIAERENALKAQRELEAAQALAAQRAQETQDAINALQNQQSLPVTTASKNYEVLLCTGCSVQSFMMSWSIGSDSSVDGYGTYYGSNADEINTLLVQRNLTPDQITSGIVSSRVNFQLVTANRGVESGCFAVTNVSGSSESALSPASCMSVVPWY